MPSPKKTHLVFFTTFFVTAFILLGIYFLFAQSEKDTSSHTSTSVNTVVSVNNSNFWLGIDKLNIKVPITANVNGENKKEYNLTLKNSLAHHKGTALPGDNGNIFIFGHSSFNSDKSLFSTIFAKLNDLVNGDIILIYYNGKNYSYTVKEKRIVADNDVSVLKRGDKEILTLMTCWPVGTKDKRLVVTANLDK